MRKRNIRFLTPALLIAMVAIGFAGTALAQNGNLAPTTIPGVQVRTALQINVNGEVVTMPPSAFQEIAPCRLVSTLEGDHYGSPWGGPAFGPNEQRLIPVNGNLVTDTFINPCTNLIPTRAVAIAIRTHAVNATGI